MATYICNLRNKIMRGDFLTVALFLSFFFQHTAADDTRNDVHNFRQSDFLDKLERDSERFLNAANPQHGSSGTPGRVRRATDDKNCQVIQESKLKKGVHTYAFNDSNANLALVWTGEHGQSLLALTTMEYFFFSAESHVWVSHDFGRTFKNVDKNLNGAIIKEQHGLLRHRSKYEKVILVAYPETEDPYKTKLYITEDGGRSFEEVDIPFSPDGQIVPSEGNDDWILAHSVNQDYKLWFSEDFGKHWRSVKDNVIEYTWGTKQQKTENFILLSMMDAKKRLDHPYQDVTLTLYKMDPDGNHITTLKENIYNFGSQGKFLFVATDEEGAKTKNKMKVLHISTDGGNSWNLAQIPGIYGDMFFSVLDMSEGMIFLHVDDYGDTGSGKLYTSDADGIIYSLSLDKHLFPNGESVTDFYKVQSMRGVYMASQEDPDNGVHTMITFDRGGEWDYVEAPQGMNCQDGVETCKLQIHNRYSQQRGIKVPSIPLSIPQAPGLILAHGNVADGLTETEPDVFVTSDGGYTWMKARDGPHQYAITNFGGLLIAIPKTDDTTDTVVFSYDEGHCWHSYKFADESLVVTGLLPEPNSKSLNVTIWGFGEEDRMWRAITIDFSTVLTQDCNSDDFLTWRPHEINGKDGCFLGLKESFRKVKPDAFCRIDYKFEVLPTNSACECKKVDYECDFGFFRKDESADCELSLSLDQLKVCEAGELSLISTSGYRKVPGDKCEGGFSPKRSMKDLQAKCNSDSIVNKKHKSAGVILVILFLAVILVAISVYLVKGNPPCKRKSGGTYRYSELNQGDKKDDAIDLSPVPNTYHDDSDEDLLA
ncbi:sortilin-like isoform X2 [Apostichopus japonicus]|uniref:sortilin-like isoform X2 n=1 Tax=Stichopus japonicus TaxID=307972 RepID=UPI003AB54688